MCKISFLIVASLSTTRKIRPRGDSPVPALAHLYLSSKYCAALETLAGPDLSGLPNLAELRGTRTCHLTDAGLTEKMDSLCCTGNYHWKRWAEVSGTLRETGSLATFPSHV